MAISFSQCWSIVAGLIMRMDLTFRLAAMEPKKDATWIVFPNPYKETKKRRRKKRVYQEPQRFHARKVYRLDLQYIICYAPFHHRESLQPVGGEAPTSTATPCVGRKRAYRSPRREQSDLHRILPPREEFR